MATKFDMGRRNDTGHNAIFVPDCDADGTFSPRQCFLTSGWCWCARHDGMCIPDTLHKRNAKPEHQPNCLEYVGENGSVHAIMHFGGSRGTSV